MHFNDLLGGCLYLLLAGYSLIVLASVRRVAARADRAALMVVCVIMLALATWRLGDGDEWLRQAMFHEMVANHSYQRRRSLQAALLLVLALAGMAAVFALRSRLSALHADMRRAIVSCFGLLAFSVARAISLHQIDKIIYRAAGPINLNRLVDLGMILCTAYFIWQFAKRPDMLSRRPSAGRIRRTRRRR